MGKHSIAGAVVGGIFTVLITWVAMADALEEGGFAIISTGIFGLAAGLCIGGLIAANFVLLAIEEREKEETTHRQHAKLATAA